MADSSTHLSGTEDSSVFWPPSIPGLIRLPNEEVIRGGFGEVCRVVQESMGRVVCLKILGKHYIDHVDKANSTQSIDEALADLANQQHRFIAEADITHSLRSGGYVPHVYDRGQVTVFDRDSQDTPWSNDWPYFIMEWIEGSSLERFLLKDEGCPWPKEGEQGSGSGGRFFQLTNEWQDRLLELFKEIAIGLAYAHRKGVAHLDLTPRNILVVNGRNVKLIDWGLARRIGTDIPLRGVGSVEYMAPEQVRSTPAVETESEQEIGFPADVYALGGIGYVLLTGKPPRQGTRDEMQRQARCPRHHEALYEELRQSGAPSFWVELIGQCLSFSKLPGNRYQDAVAVVREIDRYRADQEHQKKERDRRTHDAELQRKDAEKRATRYRWAAVAAALLVMLVIATSVAILFRLRAEDFQLQALLVRQQAEADATGRRTNLMARLARGDHSPDTHKLAARVADDFPDIAILQLVPAALGLMQANTPDHYRSVNAGIRDLLHRNRLRGDADYVTLFTKLATVHELLGRLVDQDGGLAPGQREQLRKVEREVRSLLAGEPRLRSVIVELPPLRRLFKTAELLNQTGNSNDRPPTPFDAMQDEFRWLYWQAERLGDKQDRDEWAAELYYQLGGCHLTRATTLADFSIPETRSRELHNDPVRLRQEREQLGARFAEELYLAVALFQQSLRAPAVTATPRFRLKARTFEATVAVTLLRFVPQLTPRQIDEIQQNLNAFRTDTSSAPVDAQLFSRLALLSVFCAKLTPNQQQLWSGNPVKYRDRVRRLHTLGAAFLLEWEGAEATVWPSLPQTWVPSTEKLSRQMLASLAKGEKIPKSREGFSQLSIWQKISFSVQRVVSQPLLHSPVECSLRFRKALTNTFNTMYEQEQTAANGLRPMPVGKVAEKESRP